MSSRLEIGSVIAGRYQLERVLGQGGMGTVWEAKHLMTRRLVAMKFLHAALDARPDMRRRFLRDAQAAAAVDHPNVVTVHDVFQLDDGTLVLVMARLEGESLAAKLAREAPLSLEDAVALLTPVVSAVGSAHARGVIHRDLKPDNVFLSIENGVTVVRVLDFGIAKLAEHEEAGDLTTTGTVLGTPCYMAPEQACGEKSVDHRADIWSLGAILYEALTGQRPIEGNSLGQVVKLMLTQGITPIFVLAPELPSDIAFLVIRMLCFEREDRPSDLREVHNVLTRYARATTPSFGPPISSEPNPALVNDDPTASTSEAKREPLAPRREPVEPNDHLVTVQQGRQPDSWTLRSGGSSDTASAHSMPVAPRRRHRWLFLALGSSGTLLLLITMLKSGSPAAPVVITPHASSQAALPPAENPAAKSVASAPTPLTAAPAATQPTSPPAGAPAAGRPAATPKSLQKSVTSTPSSSASTASPSASTASPSASTASPSASTASPRALPTPATSASPALTSSVPHATTGLHEAVPF